MGQRARLGSALLSHFFAHPATRFYLIRQVGSGSVTKGTNMSFHLSVADNVGFLRDWHNDTHTHAVNWSDCPHGPCNRLEPDFRKAWTK